MQNKILCAIVCMVIIFFGLSNCEAATKQDVIDAINKTYTVGSENYKLPSGVIAKAESVLNSKELSSEKYDKILRCIDSAVALARELGTTDIRKISDEDLQRGLSFVYEAANSAEVDLNGKSTSTNNSNNSSNNKNSNSNSNSNHNVQVPSENIINDNVVENLSGNVNDEISDEHNEFAETISNDLISDLLNASESELNIDLDFLLKEIIVLLIFTLFAFIVLFYLILKIKRYKILKYMLSILLSISILAIIVSLIVIAVYYNKIKFLLEFYYFLR